MLNKVLQNGNGLILFIFLTLEINSFIDEKKKKENFFNNQIAKLNV